MASDDPVNDCLDYCPYDPSHSFLRTRRPYHMLRCVKNFPNVKKKYCPYDSRHVLEPKEYDSHIESCLSKQLFVQTNKNTENETFETPGIMPVQPSAVISTNAPIERWGDDENTNSPLQSIQAANSENAKFAAPLIGSSKNQRKRHRLRQRRLAQEQEDADSKQKENENRENKENPRGNEETSQEASNKQITVADLDKKSSTTDSVQDISKPSVKAETEILNISNLKINSEKNTAASEKQNSDVISNSRPKICTFSYAAALSSKNKQVKITTTNVTNLNSLIKSKN